MNQHFIHIRTLVHPGNYSERTIGPYRWRWWAELRAIFFMRVTEKVKQYARVSTCPTDLDSRFDDENASCSTQ